MAVLALVHRLRGELPGNGLRSDSSTVCLSFYFFAEEVDRWLLEVVPCEPGVSGTAHPVHGLHGRHDLSHISGESFLPLSVTLFTEGSYLVFLKTQATRSERSCRTVGTSDE